MESDESKALFYKRANFSTRLPLDRVYSASHFWLLEQDGIWRVGLTKFGTHLLGEIVDYGFDIQHGQAVRVSQVLGWIEGFKAVSDLVSVIDGTFGGSNPDLPKHTEAINQDCYGEGWLYEGVGQPDPLCLSAQDYLAHLDQTINGLLEKQSPLD
jgi:glycine cleavage system H protein